MRAARKGNAMTETEPQTGSPKKKANFIVQYFKDFAVLKETRKEYWGLQAINALDCVAYFAMFNIVVVMLTENYGFSDKTAGWAFTVFSSLTSIFLLISGMISDWLGIKKSLYVALSGLGITRGALAVAGVAMPNSVLRDVVVVGSLALMAPFMAMLQTVFQAANKRFTTKRSRSAGFNLWYLFMNVGAMGGGFIIDLFYLDLGIKERYHIMTFGAFTAVLTIVITLLTIRNTDQLYSPGEEPEVEEKKEEKPKRSMIEIARQVFSDGVFWRFVTLITLLLGVRAVFLYISLLHPKFWLRVIGEDAKIGALQAFNPILVIIGLIVLIPILEKFNVYKMLVGGAFISSLSMFVCAIPNTPGTDSFIHSLYGALPGFLRDFVTSFVGNPLTNENTIVYYTYFMAFIFLFILTIGELIWSPRLQEYTAAIAPEGQEGTYLGMSILPYFLAKMGISACSGLMLARWCPQPPADDKLFLQRQLAEFKVDYVDSPYMMFLILGCVAMAGTILALVFKGWFTKGANFDKAKHAEEE